MVDIPIKVKDCDCVLSTNTGVWFCWDDYSIHLGRERKDMNLEKVIETCFNHEIIHVVIDELEGRISAKKFDNMFDKTKELIVREDGTPT